MFLLVVWSVEEASGRDVNFKIDYNKYPLERYWNTFIWKFKCSILTPKQCQCVTLPCHIIKFANITKVTLRHKWHLFDDHYKQLSTAEILVHFQVSPQYKLLNCYKIHCFFGTFTELPEKIFFDAIYLAA